MNLIELDKQIKKHKIIESIKDGVADGLLHGKRDDTKSHHYYNIGYDYGITLYGHFLDLVSEGLAKKNRRIAND
tara:strand:+ start:215 stop:436 length:222 start_codon:yes stop_codon:yes gene_type:complete